MAVNINTKFYEVNMYFNVYKRITSSSGTVSYFLEELPYGDWHDLSKIVFTSPNMDSPNSAGVRSHILPGAADLGLWYEDTSNMYRILAVQDEQPTSSDQVTYLDKIDLYPDEVYDFDTEDTVLVTVESMEGFTLAPGAVVYSDVDNYGVVNSVTTVTSGTYAVEDRTLSVYIGSDLAPYFVKRRKGFSYYVYWSTTGIYTNEYVNIQYTIDGGITWNTLASGVPNTGNTKFTIPNNSTAAQVKVVSTTTPNVNSITNVFIVDSGEFELLTPDTTSQWRNRNTHNVWWNSERFFEDELIGIDISFNGGGSWTTLKTDVPNKGFTAVDIPATISGDCKIKVYSVANPTSAYDISESFSTFAGDTDILVINSDTEWRNRNNAKVWWNSGAFYDGESVNVKLSYDAGETWVTMASGVSNTGYLTLNLPETVSETAQVRVESYADPTYAYDITDSFTIKYGDLDIKTPTIIDSWFNREDHQIWWNSDMFYDHELLDIELSDDGETSWYTLASGVVNTGQYIVNIPVDKSNVYTLVRVKSTLDPTQTQSVVGFSVVSGTDIDILVPNTTDILGNGVDHKVYWNSSNFYSSDNMLKLNDCVMTTGPNVIESSLDKKYSINTTVQMDKNYRDYAGSSVYYYYFNDASETAYTLEFVFNTKMNINNIKVGVTTYIDANSITFSPILYATNSIFSTGYHTVLYDAEAEGDTFVGNGIISIPTNTDEKYYKYRLAIKCRVLNIDDHIDSGDLYFTANTFKVFGEVYKDTVDILFNLPGESVVLASGIDNKGHATVELPYNKASEGAEIMVRDSNNPDHVSHDVAVTVVSGSLDLVFPNDIDLSFIKGEPMYAWWNSEHIYTTHNTSVALSQDGGNNYSYLNTPTLNSGTYNWVIPMVTSSGSLNKLKVVKNDGSEGVSTISPNFNIEEPYLNILTPISGTVFRLYDGTEYWFHPDEDNLINGYEPVNYKVWWDTNIRNNKDMSVYLSLDGGESWNFLETTENAGAFSIIDSITDLANEYDDCKLKVEHTNTAGALFSATSGSFKIRKPWELITEDKVTDTGWSSVCYYDGYIYRMFGDSRHIYRYDSTGTTYELFLDFPEDVISKPIITLKNNNIYIINPENGAFYEYLSTATDWRTLSPLTVGCYVLKSFSDIDPYLYATSNDGTIYIFNTTTYGNWSVHYDINLSNNTIYNKVGIGMVNVAGTNHLITYDNSGYLVSVVSGSANPILDSGSDPTVIDVQTPNFLSYDFEVVTASGSSNFLFCTGNQEDTNVIYNLDVVGNSLIITSVSGCSHNTQYNSFHTTGLSTDDFDNVVTNYSIVYNDTNIYSFIDNSYYIVEWAVNPNGALNNQDYTFYSIKESTDTACYSSFLLDNDIYIASGPAGKLPFYKTSISGGVIGFPEGSTYFNGYYPLYNSYVGNINDIMCTDGTTIFKFDGYNEQGIYGYNIVSGTITYLNSPPVVISELPQVVYNDVSNSIYLLHDDTDVTNLWKGTVTYSGTDISIEWSNTDDAPFVFKRAAINSIDQYIYSVEGGVEATNFLRYNVLTDTWESLSDRLVDESSYTIQDRTYDVVTLATCGTSGTLYYVGAYDYKVDPTLFVGNTITTESGTFSWGSAIVSCDNSADTTVDTTYGFTLNIGTTESGTWVGPEDAPGFKLNHLKQAIGPLIPVDTGVRVMRPDTRYDIGTLEDTDLTNPSNPTTVSYSGLSIVVRPDNDGKFCIPVEGLDIKIAITYYGDDLWSYTYDTTNVEIVGNINKSSSKVSMDLFIELKPLTTDNLCIYTSIFNSYISGFPQLTWYDSNDNGGSIQIYRTDTYQTINDKGVKVKLIPNDSSDLKVDVTEVSRWTSEYTAYNPTPYNTELYLYKYDISTDTWSSVLKRIGIADYFKQGTDTTCVCDDNNIYILWNTLADGKDLEIYKVSLDSKDFESVSEPVGYTPPPQDTVKYTSDSVDGWVAPTVLHTEAPVGWLSPEGYDYILEGQPIDWEEPPTLVLTPQPDNWGAPTNATLGDEPDDWVAPLPSGSRYYDVPTEGYTGVRHTPPIIQVPYAKSINFSTRVGSKIIDDSDSLYTWGSNTPSDSWLDVTNSILFEITNGECYNCRLTAWDDITHASTSNHMLMTDRCRVHSLVFNSTLPPAPIGTAFYPVIDMINSPPAYHSGDRYLIGPQPTGAWVNKSYQIAESTSNSWVYNAMDTGDCVYVTNQLDFYYRTDNGVTTFGGEFDLHEFIHPPAHDLILKGDVYYYGDFNMKYRFNPNVFGDYLMFKPYLYDVDETIPYGIHDFLITLHYSYT